MLLWKVQHGVTQEVDLVSRAFQKAPPTRRRGIGAMCKRRNDFLRASSVAPRPYDSVRPEVVLGLSH